MCKARISIIIPVFNGGKYLGDAIESVLSQGEYVFEIIVVDDGSTDNTAKVVETFGQTVLYCYQANAGVGAARNRGVAMAQGDFLAFLDADDFWSENKLKKQSDVFQADPALDMVFGYIQQFYSPELTEEEKSQINIPVEVIPGRHAGTMLIKKESFLRVGFFKPDLRIGEFIDWFARASELRLKSIMLSDVLMKRRIHQTNLGRTQQDQRADYLRTLKAALDRRRSQK